GRRLVGDLGQVRPPGGQQRGDVVVGGSLPVLAQRVQQQVVGVQYVEADGLIGRGPSAVSHAGTSLNVLGARVRRCARARDWATAAWCTAARWASATLCAAIA